MISAAEVVLASVHNDATSDYAACSEESNDAVRERRRYDTIGISNDISQIANVTNGVLSSTMVDSVGIVMTSGAPVECQ